MQTSPYYHTRQGDHNSRKSIARKKVVAILEGGTVGEKHLMWFNYSVQYPLSREGDGGLKVHTNVYRMYTTPLELFYAPGAAPKQTSHEDTFDIRYQRSFAIVSPDDQDKFSDVTSFFATGAVPTWRLRRTTLITPAVFARDEEAIRNFERPLVPLAAGQTSDPLQLEHVEQTEIAAERLESLGWGSVPVPTDKHDRLLVYAWRLYPGATEELMLRIQKEIGAKTISMRRYGVGFAFIFTLT